MLVPLAELRQGQRGTLTRLTCHPQEARRLAALGFAPGVWVARGRSAPFGDPVEFHVLGARYALRAEQARSIWVQPEG